MWGSKTHAFGHNFLPRTLTGTRIGGNGSHKPPGAPQTFQDLGRKPNTLVLKPEMLYKN